MYTVKVDECKILGYMHRICAIVCCCKCASNIAPGGKGLTCTNPRQISETEMKKILVEVLTEKC